MTDPLGSLRETGCTRARAGVPACRVEAAPPEAVADATGVMLLDLVVRDGRIAAIHGSGPASAGLDLGGRMVWPCPVDLHTHLDKGFIWPRAANPDGTFMGALETVRADRIAHWNASDVRARFEFGLRCAWAHGTRAIRTHLDSIAPQDAISWPVFAELRDAWAGRIELQAVSLAMLEHYAGEAGERLADRVAEHGGILGLVPMMQPGLDAELDRFFRLAADRDLEIDCHIDESLDPGARTLRHLAEAAIRNRFERRIVAGHCCSLSRQEPGEVDRTLDLVAEAGIAVVSLPMCNMYLQDREGGRTPRRRGVTLLHEMRARGIAVAVASDNCRDPFYAYGDLDLHEVFREAVRIAHLDHPVADWPQAVTVTPAAIMGLEGIGRIAVGAAADLLVYRGRSYGEILSRPETGRVVLRGGRRIDTAPPDYAELDGVVGPTRRRRA
jgi:cytosine deaminase